jgi:predicted nucleic acid-binding protein
VKLYVQEPGAAETRTRVGSAGLIATSRIAYPEARSALARRQREAALGRRALGRAVAALDRDLARCVVVELSAKVARRAGELAELRALRAFDAIHLASALELEDLTGLVPAFWCYDERLAEAAAGEGLPTA